MNNSTNYINEIKKMGFKNQKEFQDYLEYMNKDYDLTDELDDINNNILCYQKGCKDTEDKILKIVEEEVKRIKEEEEEFYGGNESYMLILCSEGFDRRIKAKIKELSGDKT